MAWSETSPGLCGGSSRSEVGEARDPGADRAHPGDMFLLWVCWSGPGARAGRRGAGWEKAVSLEKSGNLQALAARGELGEDAER